MRLGRDLLVLILAASLAAVPASAAPAPRALGLVVQAENARVGSSAALSGATVFSGDTLSTTAAGTLRVRMAAAQLYLMPNSSAALDEQQGWQVASLRQGGVGFSTSGDERLVVRVSDVQIYPATSQPTHGEVSYVSEHELLVTSVKGPLEVTVSGEVHAVPEATAYSVRLEDDGPQEVEGAGKETPRRVRVIRRVAGFLLVGTGIALILLKNAISPSIP